MPRMRTLTQAVKYFKDTDPDTCMNMHRLRQMVHSGEIRSINAGKKFMVNLDEIEGYLENPSPAPAEEPAPGTIRPIKP